MHRRTLVAVAAAVATVALSVVALSATSGASGASGPPVVPSRGAYLGVWLNPSTETGPTTIPGFEAAIGHPLGFVHHYMPWDGTVPVATMQEQGRQGTVPLLDWHCGDLDASVAAGRDDATIIQVADELKSVGYPVFVRWYWEMNLATPRNLMCDHNNPKAYITAWRHIVTLFRQDGATNVAFVWCPAGGGALADAAKYYPGNEYVDWVAVDTYASVPSRTFADDISSFYQEFAPSGKPLMVSETAALGSVQASYLQGAAADLENRLPRIKALGYFDHDGNRKGTTLNWSLTSSGLDAFKALANSAYFAIPTR